MVSSTSLSTCLPRRAPGGYRRRALWAHTKATAPNMITKSERDKMLHKTLCTEKTVIQCELNVTIRAHAVVDTECTSKDNARSLHSIRDVNADEDKIAIFHLWHRSARTQRPWAYTPSSSSNLLRRILHWTSSPRKRTSSLQIPTSNCRPCSVSQLMR